MIKAVLWDNDGTLVDSEILAMPIALEVLNDHYTANGLPLLPSHFATEYAGKDFMLICKLEAERIGQPLPSELDALQRQRTIDVLSSQLRPNPGVAQVLKQIAARQIKNIVVTSSSLTRVIPGLRCASLAEFFPEPTDVFSAHESLSNPRPKPDPAIYLHAMEIRGLQPSQCMAIEDSPSGVASARDAGIQQIFGYVGGSHIEDKGEHGKKLRDTGATHILSNIMDLLGHIDRSRTPAGAQRGR